MLDPEKIKLQAQILALEYMVAQAFKLIYSAIGASPEVVDASHEELREAMRTMTMPTSDPFAADLLAAELQEAVGSLLSRIRIASTPD